MMLKDLLIKANEIWPPEEPRRNNITLDEENRVVLSIWLENRDPSQIVSITIDDEEFENGTDDLIDQLLNFLYENGLS